MQPQPLSHFPVLQLSLSLWCFPLLIFVAFFLFFRGFCVCLNSRMNASLPWVVAIMRIAEWGSWLDFQSARKTARLTNTLGMSASMRESNGIMEWLEYGSACVQELLKLKHSSPKMWSESSLLQELQRISCRFRPLKIISGLWKVAIPYSTSLYPPWMPGEYLIWKISQQSSIAKTIATTIETELLCTPKSRICPLPPRVAVKSDCQSPQDKRWLTNHAREALNNYHLPRHIYNEFLPQTPSV